MAFIYDATPANITTLRRVFGPRVRKVVFYDSESGGGEFSSVEGYDSNGDLLSTITFGPDLAVLEMIASEWGITVKFCLNAAPA